MKATQTNATLNFYPRPPRGGRPASKRKFRDITKFLSTPSARRATGWEPQDLENLYNFYPRPPRGGRLLDYMGVPTKTAISIHALREEGDRASLLVAVDAVAFLSTPSARRATMSTSYSSPTALVFLSTPSARRATSKWLANLWGMGHFYPRPPRGGRPAGPLIWLQRHPYFYPRPPRGGRPAQQHRSAAQ